MEMSGGRCRLSGSDLMSHVCEGAGEEEGLKGHQ